MSNTTTLTISEFLNLAQNNDPAFSQIMAEKKQLDFIFDQELPNRQLLLSAQMESGFPNKDGDQTSLLSISAFKNIIETGTSLSLGQTQTQRPDRKEEVTELRLTQSLWNNSFGQDMRLKIKLLQKKKDLIQLQILENHENYINELAKTYLDFSQAYINLQLTQKTLNESIKLKENMIKRKAKNIANRTDVDRISLDVLLNQEDLILKQMTIETHREKIKSLTGKSTNDFIPETEINFNQRFNISINNVNFFSLDKNTLRKHQISKLNEELAQKNLTLEKRNQNPELDLILGQDIDNSTRFNSSVERNNTVIGLKIQIPFGETNKKANTESAKLNFYKAQLETQKQGIEINSQLNDLKNKVISLKKRLDLSEKKVILSERILKEDVKRFQRGTLPIEDLIKTKNSSSEYQFKFQSDLVQYNKALIDWMDFTDTLTSACCETSKVVVTN